MIITNTIIIINIISFIITGFDKLLAIYKRRRIPEKILLIVALLGGSIGTMTAMITFHHKTRKLKFKILIPFFIIIHILIFLQIKTI